MIYIDAEPIISFLKKGKDQVFEVIKAAGLHSSRRFPRLWFWSVISRWPTSGLALCGCGEKVHSKVWRAASLMVQIHLLPPRLPSALILIQDLAPQLGLLTRVHHPHPPTAAWVAVITVCGSNTRSSCWHITMMEVIEHLPLLKRTSWMRTWRHT